MARTPNIVHKRPPIVGGDSNYQPLTIFSNEQTNDAARHLTKTETKTEETLKPDCEGEEYSEVVRFVGYEWRMPKHNNLDSSGLESEKRSSEHASLSLAQSSSTKLVSSNTFASLVCEPITSTNQVNPD